MYKTRPANLDELDILLSFEQGIIAAERPYDSTLKDGLIHYYDIAALIKSPHSEVIVATLHEEIISSGYIQIRRGKDYEKHERFGYLGFMYVKPEHRGKGINHLVIDALIGWGKNHGISEFRLEVYANNNSALAAYEKVGFEPHLLEMRFSI